MSELLAVPTCVPWKQVRLWGGPHDGSIAAVYQFATWVLFRGCWYGWTLEFLFLQEPGSPQYLEHAVECTCGWRRAQW